MNGGWLAKPEARLLDAMVHHVPARIGPDTLTGIGIFGAALGAAGFALGVSSLFSLLLVFLGFGLNWLGDSLDGKVARHRRIERKVQGFVLDNGVDLISYTLVTVGFAASGLVSLPIPFLLLALYMLLSNLALARMLITGVHNLAIDTVGTTELRVCFMLLATLLYLLPGVFLAMVPGLGLSVLDGLSLLWAGIMLVNFGFVLRRDIRAAGLADQRQARADARAEENDA
ncbi:CDP-alcohol phosphatidyltransferase family protein [Roseococcus sp. SDR]|uniref:CDP-alcohol phosphatidyltransferase family protein n=1 Tax=Roseococcus sp. SDR TaxID=2835532 RepID=UPI001BCBFA75|nr:CDP-alcohol phosphatidyltransferase family protein [Roseococcus sp. SDR]MBS7791177.1 CDP-alcohol phosphatidyltransferase family protein [Roseococcus sp. SDR]MBV1846491.1 CDP-alcohol phosphatidyltransferase family protein [Roseococcus sp. SDR]